LDLGDLFDGPINSYLQSNTFSS